MNRDAQFLLDGVVLSQVENEGMRVLGQRQEQASTEAFAERLLKHIASNIGSKLFALRKG